MVQDGQCGRGKLSVLWSSILKRGGRGAPEWMRNGSVISHRGEECQATENTLGAFDAAIAKNMPIELDVVISADGQAVVFHDSNLERLTGRQGKVVDHSMEELGAIGLSCGAHICSLSQVLDHINGRVPVLIDLKPQIGVGGRRAAQAVSIALEGRPRDPRLYATQSFSPTYLRAIGDMAGWMRRGQLSFFVEDLLFAPWSRPDFLVTNFSSMRLLLGLRAGLGLDMVGWNVTPRDFAKASKRFGAVIADFEQEDPSVAMRELKDAFLQARDLIGQSLQDPGKLWEARKVLVCSHEFKSVLDRIEPVCGRPDEATPESVMDVAEAALVDLEKLEQDLFVAMDWQFRIGRKLGRVARWIAGKDPARIAGNDLMHARASTCTPHTHK